ncbi:hypothetical protein KBD69_03395 [Candidatus Woesebacteria bacterium]|nr:hypothetical protein [Candidatus Woesebacteria bacterium]
MTMIIFFGSDRFSAVVLGELIKQNHAPKLVVTDPPKPARNASHSDAGGPKVKKGVIVPNQVENLAVTQSINVAYYPSKSESPNNLLELIANHSSQGVITGLSASFPHLFPPSIINAFGGSLYNLHPSLLPQYRNVAPGPYAIATGDKVTGISLFPIGIGIDNGQLVGQQKELILPTDTTSTLLTRLFTIGTELFIKYLDEPHNPNLTNDIPVMSSSELIFTRKLTRESGFIEWDIVQKLINNKAITKDEISNPLIKLRLTNHPERTESILTDLIRALDTYERVWTVAKSKKGELQLTLSLSPSGEIMVLIPGKPKPISYSQFLSNYQ